MKRPVVFGSVVAIAVATAGVTAAVAVGAGPDRPALLPAIDADAAQQFSTRLTGATLAEARPIDGLATITFRSTSDGACYLITVPDNASFDGCDNSETIATGLAHVALTDGHTGVVDIVGVVPDDVSTILIAGTSLKVAGNAWHYRGKSTDHLAFTVVSANGQTASLAP